MNTDMTTKFTDQCSAKPFTGGFKVREKRHIIKQVLNRHEPKEKENGKGIHSFIFFIMSGIHIQESNNKKCNLPPNIVTGQLLLIVNP